MLASEDMFVRTFSLMALVAFAVAGNHGAHAQTYIGPGNIGCEKFSSLVAANSSTAQSIDYWIRGYVSGLNAAWKGVKGTDALLNVDPAQVSLYMLQYCEANPRKNVLNAANDYFWSLPK